MGKVRIYDLARELKLESHQIIDCARRLGIDVSVPSNMLEDVIADKIREIFSTQSSSKNEPAEIKPRVFLKKQPETKPRDESPISRSR